MIKSIFIFSTLLAFNATTITNENSDKIASEVCEQATINEFFEEPNDLNWSSIELLEIEEEVVLCFDTKNYLPKDFNPLEGLFDLDWNSIELVEIEEEVMIDFDTNKYLPKDFCAYSKMS